MNIDKHLNLLYDIKYDFKDEDRGYLQNQIGIFIKEFIEFFYSVKHTSKTIIELVEVDKAMFDETKLEIIRDFAKDLLKKCEEDK